MTARREVEYLDPDDVEALLDVEGFHFKDGARGRNLLLSALAAPMPVFGEEVHPTLDEKAAALLLAVMRNHPLADGNKRLAWFVTVAFLELNDLDLVADDVVEADRFLREVAAGTIDLDGVAAWIRHRIRPLM
ncbi:death-on-curing protein [Agromyces flavus]|uniref:Death on curing protein n=1 Tax=Agromyces flavus TaxID=589382 RepID=A0A1H1W469_9MICO|nr:type II toxin-antitoxin system death-on-curing family toxin [Agromyces flavus]MCP2366084.1 death-on-curing protein [Agromyces flavus]GGI43971.1 death-on-curing protein [Agromyces flavus]SDS91845.1 death on curing protein [Agromyces flavus]